MIETNGHSGVPIIILMENIKWEYNMVEFLIRNGFDERKYSLLIFEVVIASEGINN